MRVMMMNKNPLTERENAVYFLLVTTAWQYKTIAETLNTSVGNVKRYVAVIFDKCSVNSRLCLVINHYEMRDKI